MPGLAGKALGPTLLVGPQVWTRPKVEGRGVQGWRAVLALTSALWYGLQGPLPPAVQSSGQPSAPLPPPRNLEFTLKVGCSEPHLCRNGSPVEPGGQVRGGCGSCVLPLQVQGWAGVGAPGGQRGGGGAWGGWSRVEVSYVLQGRAGVGAPGGQLGGPWEDGAGRGSAVTSASPGRAECIVHRGVAGQTWAQLPGSHILCDLRAQVPTRVPGPMPSTFQMQRRTLCPGPERLCKGGV